MFKSICEHVLVCATLCVNGVSVVMCVLVGWFSIAITGLFILTML